MGLGMSSLGSRAGFSSSFRISVRVISPIPSSSANCFLSLIFFPNLASISELPAASFARPVSLRSSAAATVCPFGRPLSEAACSCTAPPMAAANALPMAVLVLDIRISLCPGFFRPLSAPCACAAPFPPALDFADTEAAFDFFSAAFFCISRTSSMVRPSLSSSFMAAS